jgi:hypothetical protein
MGQAEWEFWDTQHFGSYCALHKCIMEGCNMGMKFDETGCLFNMCAYHSHKFALREITKDDNAKKKRLSLSRIMETVFSSSSPKPQLKVQDQLPQRVAGTGEIVRLHEECTADTCQRLQIVDSRGVGGSCELHTEFPVLPDSVKDAEGGIPPLARVFVVDATGRMREIGEQVGAIAAVGAGALQLVSSAISIISMGMVG